VIITRTMLENARILGENRAKIDIENELDEPVDDLYADIDREDIIFQIACEKEEGQEILESYENGYYDMWWDYMEEKAA
jgi:hypothetical protein